MGQSDKANDEACPEEPVQLREPNRYQSKSKEPVRKAGAYLFDAVLSGADLSGADLTDVIWGNTTCPDRTLNSGTSPCTAEQLNPA